jgi:hypothetical protein
MGCPARWYVGHGEYVAVEKRSVGQSIVDHAHCLCALRFRRCNRSHVPLLQRRSDVTDEDRLESQPECRRPPVHPASGVEAPFDDGWKDAALPYFFQRDGERLRWIPKNSTVVGGGRHETGRVHRRVFPGFCTAEVSSCLDPITRQAEFFAAPNDLLDVYGVRPPQTVSVLASPVQSQ